MWAGRGGASFPPPRLPRDAEGDQLTPSDTVGVAFLYRDSVSGGFAASLAGLSRVDTRVAAIMAKQSGPRIASARNAIVREFLGTELEWLLFIDSDMTFSPDALDLLLQTAHRWHRPVVGGLCFAQQGGSLFPTIYQRDADRDAFRVAISYPTDTAFAVDGTGAAFLLMHRGVLEKLAHERPEHPAPWFEDTVIDEGNGVFRERGEDLTFCSRVRDLGIPIYVDARVKIGHVKEVVLDEAAFQAQDQVLITGASHEALRRVCDLLLDLAVPVGWEEQYAIEAAVAGELSPGPNRFEVSWLGTPYARLGRHKVVHITRDTNATRAELSAAGFPAPDSAAAALVHAVVGDDVADSDLLDAYLDVWPVIVNGAAPIATIDWTELDDVETVWRFLLRLGIPRDRNAIREVVSA